MRYITLYDGQPIPVVGLGTWAMGGYTQPDPSQDDKALTALRQALEMGYTHIDTAEMYANGHTEELIGKALQGFDRSQVFITTKVKPPNLSISNVLRSLDGSLRRLGVNTIDLYMIHWPSDGTPLSSTFQALNQAVRERKVRYLGVSNFNLDELKEAQQLSETPIVTNQVPYSLVTRRYIDNGVIPYCQENQIIITAYSPVEEGRLKQFAQLESIAASHNATPYQIALAWLVNQPWGITIPMAQNREHLRQNLQAAQIHLSESEMAALDKLER
jgi:diketogulonate reductase-like aldo/keto reductase